MGQMLRCFRVPLLALSVLAVACSSRRRDVDNPASGGGGSGAMGGAAGSPSSGAAGSGGETVVKDGLSIQGASVGRRIGAAVNAVALSSDATYAAVLAREFDYVTPENATKWGPLEPTEGQYFWTDADAIVEFARANADAIKGHTLVWHNQLPGWVNDALTADELAAALEMHVETTLGHFSGKMRAWDVVN
jgi:endo-1,4-beta-xylanase